MPRHGLTRMNISSKSVIGFVKTVLLLSEKATGEPITIPGDWTALLATYALRDLVTSGLPTETADFLLRTEREPVEKWEMVASYYEATRSTGYLREIDLTTERLFGLRLARDGVRT